MKVKDISEPIQCLDHGFVRLVDYMGNDSAIVQAARVSYGDGTKSVREDAELINYLLRHRHTTPFEMVEFKFHCKMPIFVARQWIRHRTANVNEYSARYSEIMDEFYIPNQEDVRAQSTTNKQGSDHPLEFERATIFRKDCSDAAHDSLKRYKSATALGVARELARMNIPVSNYTQWYWKVDLHNLLHFLKLRIDSHAQYEIRVFADAIASIIQTIVPVAFSAFEEYILYSMTLSRKEQRILSTLIKISDEPIPGQDQFSKGEWREFMGKLESLMKNRVDLSV